MKTINIGILAHVDAGKTTLTEQLLYTSGAVRQAGNVDDGTARTDFLQVERERGISVRASTASITCGDLQVNVIDTPGHADFAAEVERSLAVLDAAVLVISAVEGIQSRTELLLEALAATKTAAVIVINKVDRAGSDVQKIVKELKERWNITPAVLTQIENEGEKDVSVRPVDLSDEDEAAELTELCCDFDEALMERFLEGETISADELQTRLHTAFQSGEASPVLCMSAAQGKGIDALVELIGRDILPVKNRKDGALSAMVYQITHDKAMGRIAHVRMFGGSLKSRDAVTLSDGSEQKITQIRRYQGGRFTDTGSVSSGELAALCGLSNVKVGDVLGEAMENAGYKLAAPLFRVSAVPMTKEERQPLLAALTELSAEDPLLDLQYESGEQEIDLSVTGTIQLEVLSALLKERYGLAANFSSPTVIYKETPAKEGFGLDAYTMPKPCWAIVGLKITPRPRGSGITFSSTVPNNDIFYRYQHHVEESIPRAAKQGVYNWEVIDFHAELCQGSHHTIHTHPLDFFLATPLALMKALEDSGVTLLEPMELMRIAAPEEYAGRIIGDLTAMRGVYEAPFIRDGIFHVEARVPVAESMDYSVRLASQTGGRGVLSVRFDGYEPCPPGIGKTARRHGVDPRDRDKYILTLRSAMTMSQSSSSAYV